MVINVKTCSIVILRLIHQYVYAFQYFFNNPILNKLFKG